MRVHQFDTDIKLNNNEKKEFNSIMQKINAGDNIKANRICSLCKKQVLSYANSHTIPQSVIKMITENGKVYRMNTLLNNDYDKKEYGIREMETFKSICRECENVFSTYENGDLWGKIHDESLMDRLLLEIKVKNILHKIYVRKKVLNDYNSLLKALYTNKVMASNKNDYTISCHKIFETEGLIRNNEIDLIDYNNELNKYRGYILSNKDCKNLFHIKFLKKLDYVVPIALQEDEYYIHDIKWNVINDVYDLKLSHKIKALSTCIFPQKDSTIILMFVENECKRYNSLFNQLVKLPLEEQLKWITFLTFSYTEGYCLNNKININDLSRLKNVATLNDSLQVTIGDTERKIDVQIKKRRETFEQGFENILSSKYKIIR